MGFGDWLAQGGFHITDDQRDPKSKLGRANPHSLHLRRDLYQKGFGTYDVRPRKGMTYDQFLGQIKGDGWNIIQARDEVNDPSPWATGPHWHVAVDGRKEQQPMAGTTLADLMKGVYPMAQKEQQGMAQQPTTLASLLPLDTPLQQNGPQTQASPVAVPDKISGKRPLWKDALGTAFDFMAAFGGGKPQYWNGINEQQQLETEGRQRLAERQAEREERLADAMRPKVEQVGNHLGILDPRTGAFTPTYSAPQENEFLSSTQAWQSLTPEQQAAYAAMKDVQSPIAVSQPNGSVVRVPRTFGQAQPQSQTIDGRQFVKIGDQWMEVSE